MTPDDRLLTLHPAGKKGVNIRKDRYEIIARYILDQLAREKEMSYEELNNRALSELSGTFDGKVTWYLVTVKLDLEARKLIKRIPRTSPHRLRLVI